MLNLEGDVFVHAAYARAMPQGSGTMKRLFWPLILTALGGAMASWLVPMESKAVQEHFVGYPNANVTGHKWRPILLALGCFLPAIAAVIHQLSSTIDRYLTREFLRSFAICFGALFVIIFLIDLQDNLPDFRQSGDTAGAMGHFYLVQIPAFMMLVLPYSLMLSLLWCLGKLSKSCEIIAMIQTGRSVTRTIMPLIAGGLFMTVLTFIFSYHWAPYAEGYKEQLLRIARGHEESVATNVGHYSPEGQRFWVVGSFPNNFSKGQALNKVTVYQYEQGKLKEAYKAEKALWIESSRTWELSNTTKRLFNEPSGMPKPSVHSEPLTFEWAETPWQVIRPGLLPDHLGIPELTSWIENHPDHPLSDRRTYQTMWHFRWAQPMICLVIVLLATPLGIVFNRRGAGGGIAVAIFLCAGMLFCNSVFPTLGESGHLPPMLAAWATNIIFSFVALYLFYRRASGQPIYQTLKRLLPS